MREVGDALSIKISRVFDLLKTLADKACGLVAEAKDIYQATLFAGLLAARRPG